MILLFGDHQPQVATSFYTKMLGGSEDTWDAATAQKRQAVPFVIWANYDIPEQSGVILSPNYLGVLTAQTAGLPLTGYMNFLAQMYQELPVITPVGLITADGQTLTESELNEEQQEWLWKYETFNYCGMIDLFDEARPFFCPPQDREQNG